MAFSIPDRISSLQPQYSSSPQPRLCLAKYLGSQNTVFYPRDSLLSKGRTAIRFGPASPARACLGPVGPNGKTKVALEIIVTRLNETVAALPLIASLMKRSTANYAVVYLSIGFALLVIVVRQITVRKNSQTQRGSVVDLVKRGQLRSDRRGISKALKYDDPFNNPLVKKGRSNETKEICGKVYRFSPVTLTKEERSRHQKRRSHAYNWKRPTVYLKEGDDVPSDVDPDAVKWIPANHPFATTVSDIDEKVAQENVYQKDGVPFRIRAEHEALQKKLEALQNEQMVGKLDAEGNHS